jgi:hypothetical protein
MQREISACITASLLEHKSFALKRSPGMPQSRLVIGGRFYGHNAQIHALMPQSKIVVHLTDGQRPKWMAQ